MGGICNVYDSHFALVERCSKRRRIIISLYITFNGRQIMLFTSLSIIAVLIGVSIASIGDVCRAPQGSGTCKSDNSCTAGMHHSIQTVRS